MKTKIFKGVGIQHIDGTIYSIEDWKTNEFKPEMARGIAVGDGIHSLCLYKEVKSCLAWSSNCEHLVPGVYTTTNPNNAKCDFSGKENTDAILKAVSDGLIEDAPAAQWVRNNTFGLGSYLPAAGELAMIVKNKDEISKCSDLIGGNLSEMFKLNYCYPWASTQHSADNVWLWDGLTNRLNRTNKYYSDSLDYALACAAL